MFMLWFLHRSKDIEVSGFNGTSAFMEVRVQSIVVEFVLTHVPQLFPDTGTWTTAPAAISVVPQWPLLPPQPRPAFQNDHNLHDCSIHTCGYFSSYYYCSHRSYIKCRVIADATEIIIPTTITNVTHLLHNCYNHRQTVT